MKTVKSNKTIFFIILFSICSLMLISCEKKIKLDQNALDTKIDSQVLIEIAESNLKIVSIVKNAQESNIEDSSRTIFQLIENDHILLKNKIKEIAKNHLVVIPTILYDKNVLISPISKITTNRYLKRTENVLTAELKYYNTSVATSDNNDLKNLASEAISKIKQNIEIIHKQQQ